MVDLKNKGVKGRYKIKKVVFDQIGIKVLWRALEGNYGFTLWHHCLMAPRDALGLILFASVKL